MHWHDCAVSWSVHRDPFPLQHFAVNVRHLCKALVHEVPRIYMRGSATSRWHRGRGTWHDQFKCLAQCQGEARTQVFLQSCQHRTAVQSHVLYRRRCLNPIMVRPMLKSTIHCPLTLKCEMCVAH